MKGISRDNDASTTAETMRRVGHPLCERGKRCTASEEDAGAATWTQAAQAIGQFNWKTNGPIHVSRRTFAHPARPQQDVAGGEVAVDELQGGEVGHAVGDLDVEARLHLVRAAVGRFLAQHAQQLAQLAVGQDQHLGAAAGDDADEGDQVLVLADVESPGR